MTSVPGDAISTDSRSLAASLLPLLNEACDQHLADVAWFKADWQRGGAATATASYLQPDGSTIPVILKLPVVQRELLWLRRLQTIDAQHPVIPRLYASGESLGGYDLAWVIIEKLPHGPLGLQWHSDHIARIADAAARFHAAARSFPVDQPPQVEAWDDLIGESLENLRINPVAEKSRWIKATKRLRSNLDTIVEAWDSRATDEWQHGDLHIANALSRDSMESGEVCLIDLAEVHAGNWLEDAIYLERQLWARPERMKPLKPVKAMAMARKRHGLPVGGDYPRYAMIRRALLAGTAPKFIKSEGHPRHLEACLGWLETALNELT